MGSRGADGRAFEHDRAVVQWSDKEGVLLLIKINLSCKDEKV